MVISNFSVDFINSAWPETKTHIILDGLYTFISPADSIKAGNKINISKPGFTSDFTLYFSEIPLINIATSHTIIDSLFVNASFSLIEKNGNFLKSAIGIQLRGGWAQFLPKKSMEIEFWTDSTGSETVDYTLLDMVNDDDWNLQAMYNEPMRLRNKTNHDLWRLINVLPYQHEEPEAVNGIRMKYAELFINNQYQGIYCLGEKVKRKQLRLKKHNGSIRGELYKGVYWDSACVFTDLPNFDNNSIFWGGFEYKHPEEEVDWSNLYNLVDFVINSSDENFYSQYENHFETDNLVDYYIFLNLIRANDNTGKNIYIAKYNADTKYFYVPWDLDGTFGTTWQGVYDNITDITLSNGLYDRLINDCRQNGFRDKLKTKWISLRQNLVKVESLMAMFRQNHNYLDRNGAFAREKIAWPEFVHDSTGLHYLANWISNRLLFLDNKFTETCISHSEDEKPNAIDLIKIYPNPATGKITIALPENTKVKISVFNSMGQTVMSDGMNSANKEISLEKFSKGIYTIRLESESRIIFQKIVLQ